MGIDNENDISVRRYLLNSSSSLMSLTRVDVSKLAVCNDKATDLDVALFKSYSKSKAVRLLMSHSVYPTRKKEKKSSENEYF